MRSGPKQSKLSQIDSEIDEGKLGIARDRLQGLLKTYPSDLTLRKKLGDVYLRLGYPIEAGRFWFLLSDPDERQREAINAFLRSCNFYAEDVLKRMRVHGVQYEGASLDEVRQAITTHLLSLKVEPTDLDRADREERRRWQRENDVSAWGCWLLFAFILVAVIHFIISMVSMIFG